MFQCLWFILKTIADFAKMLFTIQVDNNLSLGLLMCICFIFLPLMLRVIKFIRQDALEEIDEAVDANRPREFWSGGFSESAYDKKSGRTYHYSHEFSRSRRYRR